jgi:hypothetical protein
VGAVALAGGAVARVGAADVHPRNLRHRAPAKLWPY